jgi:hypothetical protein
VQLDKKGLAGCPPMSPFGDIPPELQSKLLRALQRESTRIEVTASPRHG